MFCGEAVVCGEAATLSRCRTACSVVRGGEAAMSNFPNYAGPLTETILLGNLAVWAGGKKIENLYDYTFAIDGMQVGEAVKIVVQRGDSQAAFLVTPASRD